MKRSLVAPAVSILAGLIVILVAVLPAEAGKKWDESNLNGTYYYTVIQVREDESSTGDAYCSGYGTIEFYGDGTSLIEGWDRCTDNGTRWNSEPHGYSVAPDGEVILWRTADPTDTVHCQLLNNGKMLMCDGVESTPDVRSFHAVGVKE